MTVAFDDGRVVVLHDDCLDALGACDASSVDAVVTDPPYGLGFMGHEWDQPGDFGALSACHGTSNKVSFGGPPHPAMEVGRYDLSASANRRFQAWCEAWASGCLRVLKPGGHLLAFGGTRTYHRLTAGLEDAGFELRDCLLWLYGSGFPKSLDVAKAIDKAAGRQSQMRPHPTNSCPGGEWCDCTTDNGRFSATKHPPAYDYATEEAKRWDGFGTALKPAYEPIVLARKPLAGTVAGNVLAHGTGVLNIDATRIGPGHDNGTGRDGEPSADRRYTGSGAVNLAATPGPRGGGSNGRWPANVVLDDAAAAQLDAQTGIRPVSGSARNGTRSDATPDSIFGGPRPQGTLHNDIGGASRFFYCAKASKADRDYGNSHPTVKPVDLMRWLVRLVTPPDGLVLDPFAGSGTTAVACIIEGRRCLLIEREAEYVEIIRRRLAEPRQTALAVS